MIVEGSYAKFLRDLQQSVSQLVRAMRKSKGLFAIVCGLLLSLSVNTCGWSLGLFDWRSKQAEMLDLKTRSRVLNFFPIPVEEECISSDKRRRGICMNTYHCRIQNGKSHGPCALGFGDIAYAYA
ncbi:hypothetical protein HZH68_009945 [Vespula germanica]|uniref:Uncharacterized protein n=1 Tax=Vespula germanica TaxID=30212 RepID=A0A834N3X5_VESGE|nr:hypothetical protein HZH68_009945 [Vespula germanica]